MRFGVVIPSRLAPRPGGLVLREQGSELWLDGALACVRRQTNFSNNWDVYVGVDPGALVPLHIYDYAHVVRAGVPGQAAAMTAAATVAAAHADVLLFLEDDDLWRPCKTTAQLPYLNQASFISCSQRLLSERGLVLGANDYPVPSGWMMVADLWWRVGSFDPTVKWMVDGDWLGRMNELGIRRRHLVPSGDTHEPNKLGFVARHSEVEKCSEHNFLVDRTVNTQGGMAKIESDDTARAEADGEAETQRMRFGENPW